LDWGAAVKGDLPRKADPSVITSPAVLAGLKALPGEAPQRAITPRNEGPLGAVLELAERKLDIMMWDSAHGVQADSHELARLSRIVRDLKSGTCDTPVDYSLQTDLEIEIGFQILKAAEGRTAIPDVTPPELVKAIRALLDAP
jgi:hypothetical protein